MSGSSRTLEEVPKLTAMFSAISFFWSVLYEYFYFDVVGPELRKFLSLNDYVVSAIVWLPGTAALMTSGICGLPWCSAR